jgi:hypothetical protein
MKAMKLLVPVIAIAGAFSIEIATGAEAPPPVKTAPARPAGNDNFVYNQKPVAAAGALITAEQAKTVIDRFKAAYPKLGSPRMLLYVNRELVDEVSGLKLTGRTETTVSSRAQANSKFDADPNAKPSNGTNGVNITAGGSVVVNGDVRAGGDRTPGKQESSSTSDRVENGNVYRVQERTSHSLADKQTVRDVERLLGRRLRQGGASLADQRVATQLIGDKPISTFLVPTEGEAARKDREALGKITDIVIEVLMSSKLVVVPGIATDKSYNAPDIQVTAVRLSDSKIMGQASSSDILGTGVNAARAVSRHTVEEITEATAYALMEDMVQDVK